MVDVVKDKKLIERLDKESKKDQIVTDKDLIARLDQQSVELKEKSFLGGVGESVKEFFTGTKSTEFSDMREIGEYKGEGAGKVAIGLSVTPNIRSQAQIIQNQIPGSNIMEDKFGNPIVVMPDGESFYLNKPGASFQDFAQTTTQILSYIPGYSTIAKRYAGNILKRSIAQTAQAGAVTGAQEAVAVGLGAESDLTRVGLASGITLAFEGAIGPIGRATIKMFKGNPNYYKLITEVVDGKEVKKLEITKAGYKALDAAGIDVDKITPKFSEDFFNNLAKGLETEVAAVSAGAGKFGFELSTSQAKRNEEGIAALYEAAKGAFGPEAQQSALAFLRKQEIEVGIGFRELLKKFNKGEVSDETLEDLGASLAGTIKTLSEKASDDVVTKFNLIDKDAVFNGSSSNIQLLLNSVKKTIKDETKQPYSFNKAIEESTGILDAKLTPASVAAYNEVKKFVNTFKKKKSSKKIPPKTLGQFEILRKKLSSYIGAAKTNTDKKTAIAIKQEFDKLYDDTLDNLLFAGKQGDEVIKKDLKNARAAYKFKKETFDVSPKKGPVKIKDEGGIAIQKILLDPDVSGIKAINYIFGLGTVGRKQNADQLVGRLKTVFGVDGLPPRAAAMKSPDFRKLRQGMVEKMINDSIRNGKFSPSAMVRNFDFMFDKNPDFAGKLFGRAEIKLLKEFVTEVRKTLKPGDLVNTSNTAAGLTRAFSRLARQGVGIIGLKLAGINGLLFGRSAYDNAKDVFEQRAAKKLIAKEFGEPPSWLRTMNEATGTGEKLASTVATVNQVYGQEVPKGGMDPIKMTPRIKEAVENLTPEEKKEEGFRVPGVGILPNPFKPIENNQSSMAPLPATPQITGIASIKNRQDYETLFPEDTLGTAISKRGVA